MYNHTAVPGTKKQVVCCELNSTSTEKGKGKRKETRTSVLIDSPHTTHSCGCVGRVFIYGCDHRALMLTKSC
jgi:hypothetical protein